MLVFNPTDKELRYEINFKVWTLPSDGEWYVFPDDVAQEMYNLHQFLQLKEENPTEQPKEKKITPPKDTSNAKTVEPQDLKRDRKLVHPSSNPAVREAQGFGSGRLAESKGEDAETNPGEIPGLRQVMEKGQMATLDKDGVEWYGKGVESDDPNAKE